MTVPFHILFQEGHATSLRTAHKASEHRSRQQQRIGLGELRNDGRLTKTKARHKRAQETASEVTKPSKKQALESTGRRFGHVATEGKPEGIRERPKEAFGRPKTVSSRTEGVMPLEGSDAEDDAIVCDECQLVENQELLLVCASRQCTSIHHVYCVLPELYEMPEGEWFCRVCQRDSTGAKKGRNARGGHKGPANVMKDHSKGKGQQTKVRDASLDGSKAEYMQDQMIQSRAPNSKPRERGGRVSEQSSEIQKGSSRKSPVASERPGTFPVGPPPQCNYPACGAQAYYGHKDPQKYGALRTIVPTCCAKHKQSDMKRFGGRLCEVRGCVTRATFAFEGEKGRRCASHLEQGMLQVASDPCRTKGCTRTASYGFPGERKRTACADHAKAGMVSHNGSAVLH